MRSTVPPSANLFRAFKRQVRIRIDRCVDRAWNIDTLTGSWSRPDQQGECGDANPNIPLSYYLLFQMLGKITFLPNDIVYDIGCGSGRVLCYVARKSISNAVGVELSPGFAELARKNAESVRNRRSPVKVLNRDATTVDYSDGTVFFLYNPFGAETLSRVLSSIHQTLPPENRSIRIIYVNPVHRAVFEEAGWLKLEHVQTSMFSPQRMEIWHCNR